MLGRAHCTCTSTVFSMGSLSDALTVRRCVDVDVHTVLVLIQYSVWTARVALVMHISAYTYTVFDMDNLSGVSS